MLRILLLRHVPLFTLLLTILPINLPAQDSNVLYSIEEIERKLVYDDFEIFRFRDLRFVGDIGKRVILKYADNKDLQIKWRRALKGGHEFNNAPRFEVAAYELQKLFLDENEYPVPPTVCRAFSMEEYLKIEKDAIPTFKKPEVVLVMMQYWLNEVTVGGEVYDKEKFKNDPVYAKHFANANILTHLIKHADSNEGNLLTSTDPDNPRVFTVDNGVTFSSQESNRGTKWRYIIVKRLPKKTIEALRGITSEKLHKALGVIAEIDIKDGNIRSVDPTENINAKRGVRRNDNVIQLGLSKREINSVEKRIKALLKQVDKGRYELF